MKFITFLVLAAAALLALAACAPASVPGSAPTTAAQALATVTTAIGAMPTLGPTETAFAPAAPTSTAPASAPTLESTPTTAATASAGAIATAPSSAPTTERTSAATVAATAVATSVGGPTPAQAFTVVATEFKFDPNRLTLKAGQRVRIKFQNKGTVDHELEVEDLQADNVVLDLSQAGTIPEDERDEAMGDAAIGGVHEYAAAGGTATIDFTPTTAGTYTFACNLPGHKEQGMVGTTIVQP